MRIAITKQPLYIKQLSYAAFAAGTTSDVWFEDEWKKPESRKVVQSKPSEKWDA